MDKLAITKAQLLVRKYHCRDPFQIAAEAGISVRFKDLGSLNGFYTCIKRNRFIVVNTALEETLQGIICAHELGHDQLHRGLATNQWLQDYMLYSMDSIPEYQANLFAAELLLDDEMFLRLVTEGHSLETIAKCCNTDPNLAALKVVALREKGFQFPKQDYQSDFLKNTYIL